MKWLSAPTGRQTHLTRGGEPVIFWGKLAMEVFRKALKDQSIIELSPEKIGMKPEEFFTWAISGSRSGRQYKIRLLSPETARQVNDDLNEIEKGASSDAEKRINQGTYLQFMSDSYARDIDLYWLSYRLLEGIKEVKELNKDEKALLQALKGNYLLHIRETMGTWSLPSGESPGWFSYCAPFRLTHNAHINNCACEKLNRFFALISYHAKTIQSLLHPRS